MQRIDIPTLIIALVFAVDHFRANVGEAKFMFKSIKHVSLSLSQIIFTTSVALAQMQTEVQSKCVVNGKEVPCSEMIGSAPVALTVGGILLAFILFGLFWLWMLISCLRSNRSDKVIWILLILFIPIIGALLYFFMARNKVG